MDKIVFVCDFADIELRTLHRLLALRDAGAHVKVLDINAMTLGGKRPTMIIVDEISDPFGEYLVQEYAKSHKLAEIFPINIAIEPLPKHSRPYLDNRPQSKGDRHRNRRYRWS